MSGSSDPRASSRRASLRRYRESTEPIADTSLLGLDELSGPDDSQGWLHRRASIDEFARILAELGANRRSSDTSRTRQNRASRSSILSPEDVTASERVLVTNLDDLKRDIGPQQANSCDISRCEKSRELTKQVQNLESDLQMSADIGQALLRRQDTLVNKTQGETDKHAIQREQLLTRLTQNAKEKQTLEKKLVQIQFDLEAADQNHHAVLKELSDTRQQLKQMKSYRLKAVTLETKLDYTNSELQDLRHELDMERQRARAAECRSEQVITQRCTELNEVLNGISKQHAVTSSWQPFFQRLLLCVPNEKVALHSLMEEFESVAFENVKLRKTFDSCRQEIKRLRRLSKAQTDVEMRDKLPNPERPLVDELSDAELPCKKDSESSSVQHTDSSPKLSEDALRVSASTSIRSAMSDETARISSTLSHYERDSDSPAPETNFTTPSALSRKMREDQLSSDANSFQISRSDQGESDNVFTSRSSLFASALDSGQRLLNRLTQADIDTLAKRLQRQKLAGDVSYLSRSTIQTSMREIEQFRDRFRRRLEQEMRENRLHRSSQADSCIVTKRDMLVFVKLQRDLLSEIARLRRVVNEVHLNPANAAEILHEHLNASMDYASKGSWLARMLTGSSTSTDTPYSMSTNPSVPVVNTAQDSMFTRFVTSTPSTPTRTPARNAKRANALPIHMLPRPSVAKPTPMAIQACGSQAPLAGSHFPESGSRNAKMPASLLSRYTPAKEPKENRRSLHLIDTEDSPSRYAERFEISRPLRPRGRGLSDSSIHTTYVEHGERDPRHDRRLPDENSPYTPVN